MKKLLFTSVFFAGLMLTALQGAEAGKNLLPSFSKAEQLGFWAPASVKIERSMAGKAILLKVLKNAGTDENHIQLWYSIAATKGQKYRLSATLECDQVCSGTMAAMLNQQPFTVYGKTAFQLKPGVSQTVVLDFFVWSAPGLVRTPQLRLGKLPEGSSLKITDLKLTTR